MPRGPHAPRAGLRRLFRLPLASARAIHDDVDEELSSLIASRVEHRLHGAGRRMTPTPKPSESWARVSTTRAANSITPPSTGSVA